MAFGLQPVLQIQIGLAKEFVGTFVFQAQQLALDGAHAGGRHIAVLGAKLGGVVAHVLQHTAQVFQINQMPAVVVGHAEHHIEQAFLGVVEVHQARQQHRPHIGNGYAQGNAGVAEHVPKPHRKALQIVFRQPELLHALGHFAAVGTGIHQAGQIAFYIHQKHRNALLAKRFGHAAQGNGFAGTGGTGN